MKLFLRDQLGFMALFLLQLFLFLFIFWLDGYWHLSIVCYTAFLALFFCGAFFVIRYLRHRELYRRLSRPAQSLEELMQPLGDAPLLAAVLAITAEGAYVPLLLFPVCTLVIVGTYFLFTQVSVYAIRLLKRNRALFWRRTHLITLSDLAYRMKDNARMFFLVSIVSTVAFCAIGTLACYAISIKTSAEQMVPFAFSYSSLKGNPWEAAHLSEIENGLRQRGFAFTRYTATLRMQEIEGGEASASFVKLSDYLQAANAAPSVLPTRLGPVETIRLSNAIGGDEPNQLTLSDGSQLMVIGKERNIYQVGAFGSATYLVSDEAYHRLAADRERVFVGYETDNWPETLELEKQMETLIRPSEEYQIDFDSRAGTYYPMKQMANMMLFVGVLFFVAASSFLYFRLFTDLPNDQRQYSAITKLGLTEKELSRIVSTQIALLFFIPILVAVIHSAVAFVSLQNMLQLLGVTSIFQPAAMVLASFLVVQIIYFWLIRSRYLQHLKQAIR
ncbi:ABC transporter permease [Brevibacillus fulvus]|uniref:ABC transport system permease protein n=1 Tax=Brevibacillus fulvus TaxID=1125967 RepID=A0A938Y0U3_9BACL|nr:ABC transporter permease [Brevibacillus fulvus]MBM7589512.1 putative ABC transport system permease protein [Brevibacillus fulvus]